MDNNIINYLEDKAKNVNKEIEKIIPQIPDKAWFEWAIGKTKYAYNTHAASEAIITPIHDLLNRGGKRWRPALMLLCIEAVGGNSEEFLQFSALPEIIHNGTLIIDDIEDNSDMRRGEACIHKKYGVDIAINAGNAMYYLPVSILYKNSGNLLDTTRLAIYDLIAEEMVRLHVGQGMDIYWHQGNKIDISEKDYLQMCAFKTGTLARLAAKLGVILGAGTESQKNMLGHFAETIGVAFQIQDDILNLSSKTFSEKKGFGEDIHEGKRTLLVLHALSKLNPIKKKRLISILNLHLSDEAVISEAIELIKSTGAIEYASEIAKKLVVEAWSNASQILPESEAKRKLKDIADYLIQRES
jgi:geranylgeranyl pyrophosphate synthase